MWYPPEDNSTGSADRVRRSTAPEINERIDCETDASIRRHASASPEQIRNRIAQLDREWDIERALEVNAATLALTGLVLGFRKKRSWFAVPAVVLTFLLQHGVQGWCPPLPILRRLGFRTRGEIDREKYGLAALLAGHDAAHDTSAEAARHLSPQPGMTE